MPPASEPKSGSVKPKAAISSPVAMRGRYFSFCASVPNMWIGYMVSEDWTERLER